MKAVTISDEDLKDLIIDYVWSKPGQLLAPLTIAQGTKIQFTHATELLTELASAGRVAQITFRDGVFYRRPMATRLRAIDRRV